MLKLTIDVVDLSFYDQIYLTQQVMVYNMYVVVKADDVLFDAPRTRYICHYAYMKSKGYGILVFYNKFGSS